MVDFEWYRSFISIYKHSSVSEAARTRMMTQPAMSQHLASLEAEVGEPLFTRAPRKMIPTERGKALYTQVVPLIEALEETTQTLNTNAATSLPVIRIGSAHEFFREKLAPYIGSYQMRVIAYLGVASKILEFLLEEKVDLIVMSQKLSAPGVEYIPYMQEEFALVAPPDYREPTFDDKESFEAWLCSQPWISYDLDLPIIRRFWREHFQKRPQTHPTHVVPDLHSVLKAIEHGAGISLLPTFMLDDHLSRNKVKIMYPSCTVYNDLYLAYQVKNRNLPHLKTLIETLKKAV
ncbi:LysR family transcriptional regulator [Brevibacillus brevis]|uniref:LysR family transcriptional regulator n=1 Tax=Brevibacillus brevis TaxID=1393 RepID=UPI000D0F4DD1|nr:LysR family transcriptional regulator [Brevibacillus brevis]PSJ65533.1 LysR family transcriptional regulator [Brevibacillus brevis]RED33908.1 DNA-binding transcriptional LysR family regulator [Brevibacillus brevis]GEC89416.1 LysR family transcriptional regulator [Brevibacillus brevis]VEF92522.1 CysJI operon transcriptional activator [Brevibacillus brevis]